MHDEIRSIYLIMNSLSRDVRAIRIKIDDQIPELLRLLKLALPHLANLEQPTKGSGTMSSSLGGLSELGGIPYKK
jgi:hypothetical protein